MGLTVFGGLRVVDFSQGMAGPLAGAIMADNGADVIKVEPPVSGDWARAEPGFHMWNRGKRSVVLDLHTVQGNQAARNLVADSDVLIESFRPGVMARLGLGYEWAAEIRPALVYCSISGFGPLASFQSIKGYENVVAARAGLMLGLDDLTGRVATAEDVERPIYLAIPTLCYGASQLALQGIGSALIAKKRTGCGDHVQTSLLEAGAALIMRRSLSKRPHVVNRLNPQYRGIRLTFLTAECKDGKWIQMCARQDEHFRAWLQALGLSQILTDPRYVRAPMGIPTLQDVDDLEVLLRERMLQRTQAEWMHLFTYKYDVGADPFLTPEEFLSSPQMLANDRVVEIDDPIVGVTRQVGPLVLFSDTPSQITRPAPSLGEHSSQVLAELAGRAEPQPLTASSTTELGPIPFPLDGITVIELAYFLAAPLGTTLLAELGARVIKIEPLDGDPYRKTGVDCAYLFHGKESIAIDLKSEAGRQILHKLIAQADALMTSFRPSVHERLNFDYETTKTINPRLVFLYSGAYGSRGPEAHRPGFHSTPNAVAGGGIRQAGEGNHPVDGSYPDPCSGVACATAIILGLLAREQTGKGQYLEASMISSTAYALSDSLVLYDRAPKRRPVDRGQHGSEALYRLYECAEGWVFLAARTEEEWRSLASKVGRPDWLSDRRFSSAASRLTYNDALCEALSAVFRGDKAAAWEHRLLAEDVPCVRADGLPFQEFLVSEGLVTDASHRDFGEYLHLPPKYRFTKASTRYGGACSIGEQTRPILSSCGYNEKEILELMAARIVSEPIGVA